jgi:regulator of replication initiation timing
MNLKERVKLIFTSKSKLNARIKYLEEQLKTYRDDRVSVITITKELNAENDHLLKTIKDTDQKIQHYRNLIDYICDVF